MTLTDSTLRLRACKESDLPAIRDIVEHYVNSSVVNLSLTPPTIQDVCNSWIESTSTGLPYLVAIDNDSDTVLGYAYAGDFRGGGGRAGYRHTVELSLYCHPDHMKRGIGSMLLRQLIEILKAPEQFPDFVSTPRPADSKVRMVLAVMSVDETTWNGGLGVRDFYVKHGFDEVGHMKGLGHKCNRWCAFLQMIASPEQTISKLIKAV